MADTASSSQIELLRLLASRLERLSVDSRWARRASGLRGNIIKVLEEAARQTVSSERVDLLINRSFEILRAAAKEIPDIDSLLAEKRFRMNSPKILSILFLITLMAACQLSPMTALPTNDATISPLPSLPDQPTASPEPGNLATPTASPFLTPTITPLPPMGNWQDLPIIPDIGPRVLEIYAVGQALGRDSHHFSVIGDCQSIPFVFMGPFSTGELQPDPVESYLWEALNYFQDSFGHWSVTARGGFTAASILNPLQADPQNCKPGETPLTCEYRTHNPAYVFITLETWRAQPHIERYELYLRQILDYVIERGTIPILLTKADAAEANDGVQVINPAIARVAYEYQVPLVNFWRAAQQLENGGIDFQRDNFHLTPEGYKLKNLLALRTLYLVWSEVQGRDFNQEVLSGLSPSEITQSRSEEEKPEVTLPDCAGGCIFFGTAISHDGTVTTNGVFAYAYETRTLTQVLQAGFDLQDVSEDGQRLLVNHDQFLYEIHLTDGTANLITDTFYASGRQGAYWDRSDQNVIYLDSSAPIQADTGQAIHLYNSGRDGEIYFESGACQSKDFCQSAGLYRLDQKQNLTRLANYKQPVFSPDGAQIAYLNPAAAVPLNYFHIGYMLTEQVGASATTRKVLYFPEEHGFMYYPEVRDYVFSPQGNRLMIIYDVYSEYFEQSQALQAYLWDLNTGILYNFGRLPGPSAGLNPRQVWSPDGTQVLYFLTTITEKNGFAISVFRSDLTTGEKLQKYAENILLSQDYLYLTNIYWRK